MMIFKKTNKNLNNDKKGIFNKFDIIFYALILLIVAFSIIFISINKEKGSPEGFCIYLNNELVFTFRYEDNDLFFNVDYIEYTEVDLKNSKIKVFTNTEKTEFNVISFDKNKKSVKIVESTCSVSKDCTYFLPITTKSGVIYCKPHDLKILPLGSNGTITPTIG